MRSFLSLIAFTFACCQPNAQLSFGAKAGLNMAKLDFASDEYSASFKLRMYAGGWVNYNISEKSAIQVELLYSGEGGKYKVKASGTSGEIREAYLQLPVLFQYSVSPSFYVEAGPQVGLLLSSKEDFGTTKNTDIKKYYKSTDVRIPAGIGYRFSDDLDGLSLNARYSFSLLRINKSTVGAGDLRNNLFSIGVQYALKKFMK